MVGLWGFVAALALLLLTARIQTFLPGWWIRAILCVFPVPVACGLAVGLVSPRKAIAWAPLWSGVFGLLLIALLSVIVRDPIGNSGQRIAWMLAGTLMAAGAGLVGQFAAARSCAGKSVIVLVAACCLLSGSGDLLLQSQLRAYERDMLPRILLELDEDYIALPRGMQWECRRDLPSGNYALSSTLNGKQLRVLAMPGAAVIDHVEYDRPGRGIEADTRTAMARYLKAAGVRDEFLIGLTRNKNGRWESVLRGTQLTLHQDGHLRMDATTGLPARSIDSGRPM